ncbi:hypothetical protein JCM12294_00200 [Desulfocicer niacini]
MNCPLLKGAERAEKEWGVDPVPVWEKLPPGVIRAITHDQVAVFVPGLKVVRCPCIDVYPKEVSPVFSKRK